MEKMKIIHQARLTYKKGNQVNLAQSHEDMDFAAIALTGATFNLTKSAHS